MCDQLERVGLDFEYGSGCVGQALGSLINDAQLIVIEALGLHEMPIDKPFRIYHESWPTTIDVLYTEDNDPDWSITMDDFFEFFNQAIKNPAVRELMWNAMANKDIESREIYNAMNCGRIGEVK
jgi:hypothetical protein